MQILRYFFQTIICYGVLSAQELPHGKPNFFQMKENPQIKELTLVTGAIIPQYVIDEIEPVKHLSYDIYHLRIKTDRDDPVRFELIPENFSDGMELFFIDLEINGWVGPYSKKVMRANDQIVSGGLNSKNILIEVSVPQSSEMRFPVSSMVIPRGKPDNFDEIMRQSRKRKNLSVPHEIKENGPGDPESNGVRNHRDHFRNILICGYWPPTNEMVRPFSTNEELNPDGWIGDNWEERGYDVHSYFPTFDPPDCEVCGQGEGDLEVDYQDTSEDWWNIVDSINPIAIITFSRGGIDYRWELEWMTTNWEASQWIEDFEEPLLPTPSPPDSTWPYNAPRYSSLPMDSIEAAMNLSGLNLYPVIDYTFGTGNYLSEYLGYHGVWYKAQMDSLNQIDRSCHLAGHIHVGGLADWDEAIEAVNITLREVIEVLDEEQVAMGDVNFDGSVSILDLYFIISYLMQEIEFDYNTMLIADVTYDQMIDVFDILQLSDVLSNSQQ